LITRIEDNVFREVAAAGPPAQQAIEHMSKRPVAGTVAGRAIAKRQTIQVEDIKVAAKKFPATPATRRDVPVRTMVSTPLLRGHEAIGAITVTFSEVRPLPSKQIELLESFADQAVIAIENARLLSELRESLQQQTTMSAVLRVIASSPASIEPVLQAVAENAARLCDAPDILIQRIEGGVLRHAAYFGTLLKDAVEDGFSMPVRPGSVTGRAVVEGRTNHITDLAAVAADYPDSPVHVYPGHRQIRTLLATPLLREGEAVGTITAFRTQVRPFTDKQIGLIESFADQAVIAIENARLLDELNARNRELSESLEQQTATGSILRAIANSPTDFQPVLDTIANTAHRLFNSSIASISLAEGGKLRFLTGVGRVPKAAAESFATRPLSRASTTGRAFLDRQIVHIEDIQARADEFRDSPSVNGADDRTVAAAPLMREGEPTGAIFISRNEVRPFTQKELDLLASFADQAVIAIENVRLFQALEARTRELSESLEQQTATSEVLRVIASSPGEPKRALDTIAATAARLFGASGVSIRRVEDGVLRHVGTAGSGLDDVTTAFKEIALDDGSLQGRAVLEKQQFHIEDIDSEKGRTLMNPSLREVVRRSNKTLAMTPLVREGEGIGVMTVHRSEVRPFTDKELQLMTSFADQAVIAIENARLLDELNARNRALTESLEQQTATSEVLRAIVSSPGEARAVLQTIASIAHRLFGAHAVLIGRIEDGVFRHAAAAGLPARQAVEHMRERPIEGTVAGRAIAERRTIQVDDIKTRAEEFPGTTATRSDVPVRTMVTTPLLREGEAIGAITIAFREVQPLARKQVELLESFAAQAVIAIENARLLEELNARNRDLSESLEQQTATAEILRTIASAPAEAERALDAVCESAVRIFGASSVGIRRVYGNVLRFAGAAGPRSGRVREQFPEIPLDGDDLASVTVREARQFAMQEWTDPVTSKLGPAGTWAATPLLRRGEAIGAMIVIRDDVKPFNRKELQLMRSFADQAVIAIENARLLGELNARMDELSESLEQQTATSNILRAIAGSPTEVQPVLDTIASTAHRLFGAYSCVIVRVEGDRIRHGAAAGRHAQVPFIGMPIDRGSVTGRAVLEKRVVHVEDIERVAPEFAASPAIRGASGERTLVAVPLMREGEAMGAMMITRGEVRPFTAQEIDLLASFADQAVIAIENARLLDELQTRTRELADSVEELKALGAVGQAVSSTLDLQAVLDAIARHAAELAGADASAIYAFDDASRTFELQSAHRLSDALIDRIRRAPIRLGEGAVGLASERQEPVQFSHIEATGDATLRDLLVRSGHRALLSVPMVREESIVGGITVMRAATGEFPARTIELLENFATQSALAIQNARLFKDIEETSRALALASQHKSQFVANMSHELRTPLAAMLGYAELMKEGIYGALPEKASPIVARMQANGKHLLGLINTVLDISKIESGQFKLNLADYSLAGMVETVRVATESLAGAKKLAYKTEVAGDLPHGLGDEQRLTQVLLNLVGNAIKFTDAGEVRVMADVADGRFTVAVSDTGPGIPAEEQEKIFEEFHQVDSSNTKKKGGTGLGLAIAKQIVEMHGGRIWVESTLGEGSTFRMELPVRASAGGAS
jgi:GAF domain-containing protein